MSNGVKGKQNKDAFFTIEFLGVTVIITAFLLLICLIFGENVLFEIGKEVQVFLLGSLGWISYPVLLVSVYFGIVMLVGKKPSKKGSLTKAFGLIFFLLLVMCLLTVITSQNDPESLSTYVSYAFDSARLGGVVAGGALCSLITFFLVDSITYVGSILLFSALVLIDFILIIYLKVHKPAKIVNENGDSDKPKEEPIEQFTQQPMGQTVQPMQTPQGYQQPQYAMPQNQYGQQYPQTNQYGQPINNGYNQPNFNGYPNNNQNQYVQPINNGFGVNDYYQGQNLGQNQAPIFNDPETHNKNMQILYGNNGAGSYTGAYRDDFGGDNLRVDETSQKDPREVLFGGNVSSPIKKEDLVKDYTIDDSFSFSYKKDDVTKEEIIAEPEESVVPEEYNGPSFDGVSETPFIQDEFDFEEPTNTDEPISEVTVEQGDEYAKKLIENMPVNYKYKKPPVTLFATSDNSQNNYEVEVFKAEVKAKILNTLKTFGVETEIPRVFKGPAVTRFDIAIPSNVPMSKVTKLQGDLNLRIAAKSAIRMIAPVPNTSYVGIEVPNKEADTVNIKDIIVSDGFINSKPFSLTFALGKDVIGTPVSLDLADMPHVLVTGTTGSGKSVCLNTLIISLITKYGPDELRFVIVDPKRVDLEPFKDIPHMMFGEIIEDVPMTNSMLTWAVEEMESRYKLLASSRSKNIKDYNTKARSLNQKIMPRIVIIMDEFADIMLQDKKGVATKVCLLAQKARAAGIHLVLAAQRPSVDVVEGPIKSNLPARIVFRASSAIDSQVSLGEPGAEKLLGKGDCLYKTGGMLNIERVMGAYVSDEEMYAVIDYVSENNDKYYDYNNWAKITARVNSATMSDDGVTEGVTVSGGGAGEGDGSIDPLYIKAMRVGYSFGGLSMSFLQRKLAVGFPKAGKIIDWLTDNGYITPNAVGGKRQMIMTKEDFEEKFGAE